ncbi:unnamed protein product, partial [Gulo gulo]
MLAGSAERHPLGLHTGAISSVTPRIVCCDTFLSIASCYISSKLGQLLGK